MEEIDRLDAALLEAVQVNNRLTFEELAEIVHLSPSACQRRLKRLRAEGIVEADVSIVSPQAAGRHITMIVMVSLERERADIVDRFKAAIRKAREVMIGYYVTGAIITGRSIARHKRGMRSCRMRPIAVSPIAVSQTVVSTTVEPGSAAGRR